MQFAHWLMVAGAALVVLGFIGFVVRKNDAEPAGNNLEPATQSRAEGEEEMSDEKRSTDPGLSAAELLNAAGLKTVGEIRQMSDDNLLALQDFGPGSVTSLRETLGPSTEGVSPTGKKP
jgi:DNA-directed RNA polymerase alpha subunit